MPEWDNARYRTSEASSIFTSAAREQTMPKGVPIQAGEIEQILTTWIEGRKRGMTVKRACEHAAMLVKGPDGEHHSWKVIHQLVQRYRPSTKLARMYFQSRALKMARRVVEKGTTSELIDVLSRPNMGVLDPRQAQEQSGSGPLFLAISADSCGAVKAVAGHGLGPALPAPAASEQEDWYEPIRNAQPTLDDAEAQEGDDAPLTRLRQKAQRLLEAKATQSPKGGRRA